MNDLLRILSLKDIATADEHINTRCNQPGSSLTLYTTIDLNQRLALLLGNHLTQAFHLIDSILDKLLSAKPRIDTHQQHHIHIANNIFEHVYRC